MQIKRCKEMNAKYKRQYLDVTPEKYFQMMFNAKISWIGDDTWFRIDDKTFNISIKPKEEEENEGVLPEIELMRDIERKHASKDDNLVWGVERFAYKTESHLFDSYQEWYQHISGYLPNKTFRKVIRKPNDYYFLRVELHEKYDHLHLITKRKTTPPPAMVMPNHLLMDISGDVFEQMHSFLLHPTKIEGIRMSRVKSADWLEKRFYRELEDGHYFGENNSVIILFHELVVFKKN
eukprot:TCONS_00058535-protein